MSILLIILVLVGIILVGGIIYLASLPGTFTIEEQVFIVAPRKKVFAQVLNFRSWTKWSPWVMHEPSVKITYSKNLTNVGGNYSWDGEFIGAGNLAHSKITPDSYIKQQLTFIRPFKSKAVTEWKFKETSKKLNGKASKGTQVSWIMHSSMPFLFRPMVPMIKRGVSSDYKLGLLLLAQTLDPKADKLKFNFVRAKELKPRYGVYESFSGKLQDLLVNSPKAFGKLEKRIKDEKLKLAGSPFQAYWQVNLKNQTTNCDFVWPVATKVDKGGKTYPGGKYFRIEYQGSYQYLEQVWNAAMGHVRMKKQKLNSKIPSLEIYETDPRTVKSPNDLKTVILIPVK